MNALEFIETIEDIRYMATVDCICGPEENNPECPLFLPEDAIRELRNEKAMKILKEKFPTGVRIDSNGNVSIP